MALQGTLLRSEISTNFNNEEKYSIQHRCRTYSCNKDVNMNETKETDIICTIRSENLVKRLVANFESKQNPKEKDKFIIKNRVKSCRPNTVSCHTTHYDLEQIRDIDKDNSISHPHDCENIVQRTSVFAAREDQRISYAVQKENEEANVSKKKSFKDMLNFVIGQKKHDDKSRRFRSCDELNRREGQHIYIPRVRSFQVENKEVAQNTNRYATIRPIYGGRKYPKAILSKSLQSFTSRTLPVREDLSYRAALFSAKECTENLVKPSTIRNITGRVSQHSGQVCNGENKESGELIYDLPAKRSKEKTGKHITSDNQYENVHAILPAVTKSTKDEFLKRRERKARAYKEYCKGFLPSSYEKGRIRRRWILNPFDECINL